MDPVTVAGIAATATAAAGYFLNDKYQFAKDMRILRGGLKARKRFEAAVKNQECSAYNLFEDQCRAQPMGIALIFGGASYTWRDLELASNRMAHWFVSKGIKSGDRVAMMMHNSPLFVITWLGILKIAAVPAFINNQIAGTVLVHSLKVGLAKLLIFDYELAPIVHAIVEEIKGLGYDLYTSTPRQQVEGIHYSHLPESARQSIEIPSFFEYIDWEQQSTEGFPRSVRKHIDMKDPAALIYTSGTTGFPKAAVIDHGRVCMATTSWAFWTGVKKESRVYITLPLYHSAGSVLGLGQSWISGCTVVLARKFSVTNFWKECVLHDVTHFQYIGELCRYLLNAPESPLDKAHKIEVIFGNGMRPDIWAKFQERFNIPTVFEYYSLSEGTGALLNIANKKRDHGAVGFRGPIVSTIIPGFRIAKVDLETEELIRNKKTGFCIEVGPNEVGELLTLADGKLPSSRYVGYFNQPELSQSKLVNGAFSKGDIYMRTGDLLYRSKDNYWYFADRTGDTYRWKGENVSTAEIADTMGQVDGMTSCTVYGVSVLGQDGRAGMAAIVLKDSIHGNEAALAEFMQQLGAQMAKGLPPYAVPRFIRICEQELETTGTFKNKKVELRKKGFDLNIVKDRMYWWSPQGHYLPFGHAENAEIVNGHARL